MLIRWKQLKKIPVYTESGLHLGKVVGLEIDLESHIIRAYFVRKMFAPELSIHREQVLSITIEKMTVEDGAVKGEAYEFAGSNT